MRKMSSRAVHNITNARQHLASGAAAGEAVLRAAGGLPLLVAPGDREVGLRQLLACHTTASVAGLPTTMELCVSTRMDQQPVGSSAPFGMACRARKCTAVLLGAGAAPSKSSNLHRAVCKHVLTCTSSSSVHAIQFTRGPRYCNSGARRHSGQQDTPGDVRQALVVQQRGGGVDAAAAHSPLLLCGTTG